MGLIFDAGGLIALERRDRHIMARAKEEASKKRLPTTHAGIVAQVWRGGAGRQTNLARALGSIDIAALDEDLGKKAGVLLGRAAAEDPIDAALVLLADDGDQIYTSDPEGLRMLAYAAGIHVELVKV